MSKGCGAPASSDERVSSTKVASRATRLNGTKRADACTQVQRVDCSTQTDSVLPNRGKVSTGTGSLEAILGRSRSTQTSPHARSVFTRSTHFLAPLRPNDLRSGSPVQTETIGTGPRIGTAGPFNHVTVSGDRRAGGGGP